MISVDFANSRSRIVFCNNKNTRLLLLLHQNDFYIGIISPGFILVVAAFQFRVLGWTGVTDDDLGLGRPTNTLVVLPLNALMFSESLAEGSAAETGFKDIL
jgi:hypothetical protein